MTRLTCHRRRHNGSEEARCSASRETVPVHAAPRDREQRIDGIGLDVVALPPGRPGPPVDQPQACSTLAPASERDRNAQLMGEGLEDRWFRISSCDAQRPADVLAVHDGLDQTCREGGRRRPREIGCFLKCRECELLLGPKRFSDIQRDVIGIGPAVLTQRLQELEASGIAQPRRMLGPGRIDVYELTEWGYGLEAVNTALSLWAVDSPALQREAGMSPDTVVLAMRAHSRPAPGCAGERRVALSLTDSRRQDTQPVTYLARMSARATTIDRSLEPEPTDAQVWATTQDWKAAVIGGAPLELLPHVFVSGSHDTVRELIEATALSGSAGRADQQPRSDLV